MSNSNLVRIDRRKLLEFFDTKPEDSRGHASAINAVAGEDLGTGLLKHYFENHTEMKVTILDGSCTQHTRIGHRLDCWIVVERGRDKTLYQVETKNWSAHAIGGKMLPLSASHKQRSAYQIDRWRRHWDIKNNGLGNPKTDKVLTRMKPPKAYAGCKVEPLLCMWEAMHPNGAIDKPYFSVAVPGKRAFKTLRVFSMSAYLRTLTCKHLSIEMPNTNKRLDWLGVLFHR